MSRASERRWRVSGGFAQRLFADSADAHLIYCGAELTLVDANPAACELLERHLDDMLDASLATFFDQHDGPSLREFLDACPESLRQSKQSLSVRTKRGDGTCRVQVAVAPLADSLAVISMRPLFESEQQSLDQSTYQLLVDSAPVCVHGIDREGRLSFINRTGLKMLEVEDSTQLIGSPYLDFVVQEHRARVAALMERALQGEASSFEFQAIVGGRRRIFSSSFIPVVAADGSVGSLLGATQDITTEKAALRELQTSERKLNAIFEHTGMGVALVEIESGRFAKANRELVSLLGTDSLRDDMVTMSEVIHPDDRGEFQKELVKLLAQEVTEVTQEVRLIQDSGKPLWVRLTASTVLSGNAPPRFHVVVIQNIHDRKRTEYELALSQRALQNAQSRAGMGSWEFYPEPLHSSWSPEMFVLYYRDPAVGAPETLAEYLEMVHPDDRQSVIDRNHKIWETDEPLQNLDVRTNPDHGPIRWLDTSAERIPDEQMACGFHVAGTALDITDRKLAESALRESEQRYRTLVEDAPEAIIILDVETRKFVDFNKKAAALLHYPLESLSGLTLDDINPEFQPDGRPSSELVVEYIQQAMAGKFPTFEWVHLDSRGKEVPCEVRLQQLIVDSRTLVRGSVTDISRRKEAEQQLRTTRFAIEHTRSVILQVNACGQLTYANQSTLAQLDYSSQELLECSIWDIDPHWKQATWEEQWRQFKIDMSSTYESELCGRNDARIPVKVTADYFQVNDMEFMFAFCADISQRRRAEQKLHERETQLAHVSRLSTMGEMVAGIAHELNQPLYSIVNFSKAIRNLLERGESEVDAEVIRWNEQVCNEASRAGQIIKRMRGFVQRDSTLQATDLHATIHEALELLKHQITRVRVAVDCDLDSPEPIVRVDRIQIQQVLINLIVNAIEAIEVVDQNSVSDRRITITSHCDATKVRVAVSDTGSGLPPERESRIFNAFETTKPEGLGMGLAISNTIIESYRGTLDAENNERGGATFTFTLPLLLDSNDSQSN